MENLEEMQAPITQVAIQAATLVAGAMRLADPPAKPHTSRRIPEHQRPRQAGPMMS